MRPLKQYRYIADIVIFHTKLIRSKNRYIEIVLYHVAKAEWSWQALIETRACGAEPQRSALSPNINGYYRTTVITQVLSIRDARAWCVPTVTARLSSGPGMKLGLSTSRNPFGCANLLHTLHPYILKVFW